VTALLHRSGDRRACPFPGQTYPAASVIGVPSAVKPFRISRANAIGSREPAMDANLELRDLTVEGEPSRRHRFKPDGERRSAVGQAALQRASLSRRGSGGDSRAIVAK
jgi:hypothetical protein